MKVVPTEASELLQLGESAPPPAVQRAEAFIKRLGIWFAFSRNCVVRNCPEAAHNRKRLGHKGIPLWDEMKSSLGKYRDAEGKWRLLLAHCRADQRVNEPKLAATLSAKLEDFELRLPKQEITDMELEKGLVNPWGALGVETPGKPDKREFDIEGVLQIFDDDLLQSIGTPGTVMTNAGSLTWAVKFHPHELVQKLTNAKVADIAEPDPTMKPRLWGVKDDRPIGIITGNPPEAGMYLWQLINKKVREALGDGCCGDVSMPRMEVLSVPEMGLSMEMEARRLPVEEALQKATRELVARGVKLLALPCNTTSFFAPQMHQWCAGRQTRFLSMAEVTGAWLRRESVTEAALVGINYVADLGHWSAYREPLAGIRIELLNGEALERVRALANKVKQEGPNTPLLSNLRDILKDFVKSKHVVLALTELSLLLELQKGGGRSGKVLIDPMNLYADALMREHLGIPEESGRGLP